MAGYTGIFDVSSRILEVLREGLCPDLIPSPDQIGICSPDKHGDFVLGIHLYDVQENTEYINTSMTSVSSGMQRYPSTYLSLHYMITPYSTADVKYRESEDQRILGRVIQILADNAVLAKGADTGNNTDWILRLMKLGADEKHRMWTYPNMPVHTSLYYKAAPVEIESGRTKEIRRVTRTEITVQE